MLSLIIPHLRDNLLKKIETAESIQYELRDIFSLNENDILDNSIFLNLGYLFI